MSGSSPSDPQVFTRHIKVETPENVTLDLELAGLGSRALAAMIDALILAAWSVVVVLLTMALTWITQGSPIVSLAAFILLTLSYAAYFILFEGLRQGQTPGKRRLGIRVVRDTGHPVTLGPAAVRNVLRLADILPPPLYVVGGTLVALTPKGQRLGDMTAGTIVVRDQPQESPPPRLDTTAEVVGTKLEAPELEDAEFHLLRRFHDRLPSLEPAVRDRVAEQLTERLAGRYPIRPPDPFVFLADLYQREQSRREHGPAIRTRSTGAGSGGSIGERFVASQNERWAEFHTVSTRVSRKGLDDLRAEELPDFAARYREVAADLARARTYGVDRATISRLERLVSAGHNAFYRDDRHTLHRVWSLVLRESPAAVVQSWRYVLVAFLVFAVPAVGGFAAMREQPSLAEEVLPEEMLRRAEDGVIRQAEGGKYFRAEGSQRPTVATYIIGNNVRVAAMCFAGGVFVGVGSLVLLAYNGVALGTIGGHFANVGLLGYLLEFIVGHGVLELFAIWVAGAAGFLLGASIVAPGRLTRSEALTQSGRRAIRMVAAATVMLFVAGLIEGFLSAGDHGFAYRTAVSGASVVFLILYLLNGSLYLRRRQAVEVAEGR